MSQENFFDKFLTQKPKNHISAQIYRFIHPPNILCRVHIPQSVEYLNYINVELVRL